MTKIQVLDNATIDKIAAGEVVERPSSVVKELVENAIDAGATAVTVEIKEGGISFIRITDNGEGIEAGQVRDAFLRHATSKIRTSEDLNHIQSLGFRGEALSSIAAVAQVEMMTKTRDSLMGVHYCVEGGKEISFNEVGVPDGTTILVKNLFFNTPARRKFLKTPTTEGGYIADLCEHLAMSKPEVSFRFIVNGQVKFHTSGNGDTKEIIYRIFGREFIKELIPIDVSAHGMRITGFLGKPTLNRSNRNFENCFINGRYVKSIFLYKSIEEGYKAYLMQHKFPFAVLYFEMDTEKIDVNVHPTKMDIRITDSQLYYEFISKSIASALQQKELIPDMEQVEKIRNAKPAPAPALRAAVPEPFEKKRMEEYKVRESFSYQANSEQGEQSKGNSGQNTFMQESPMQNKSMQEKNILNRTVNINAAAGKPIQAKDIPYLKEVVLSGHNSDPIRNNSADSGQMETQPPMFQRIDTNDIPADNRILGENPAGNTASMVQEPIIKASQAVIVENPIQMNLFEEKILTQRNRDKFSILGQVFDTYWLVNFEDKLLFVDQHAAHEKVKYEKLMAERKQGEVLTQNLQPPLIFHLTQKEEAALEEYSQYFKALGFTWEDFGSHSIAMRAMPVEIYGKSEKGFFEEILDELIEYGCKGTPEVIQEKIASMACKAAVKGNQSMNATQMNALIEQLLELENPYHCPHGRPTMISMSRQDLEKKFKRIV